MKKLLYTLLTASIIFSSCQDDDDITAPTVLSGCNDPIATNYNSSATNNSGCVYGIVGGAWITDVEEANIHAIVTMGGVVFMDSTWTVTETNPDSMENGVLQKFWSNGEVKFWDNNNNLVDSGTWVQSGTTVTITTDTVTVGEILSVTKTNLVHEVIGNETFTENGVDYDIDYTWKGYHTRDPNGFTTNNTNLRTGNTSWINKRKLMNIIKR
tara:strand:- start:282 stop:917 length:636 start_codon:yes stop_codon:yes gene_type:complete